MHWLSVVIVSCWVSLTAIHAAEEPQAVPEAAARLQILKDAAAAYTIAPPDDSAQALQLIPDPLLHYSNPVRANVFSDGTLFVWCERERPVVAGSLSIRNAEHITRELAALTSEPLECRLDGAVVWAPKSAGLLRQAFPDSPIAAAAPRLRLSQMRALARRFGGTFRLPSANDPTELRLVSQPVYRYSDQDTGIVDGAMFCLGEATDPELLLLIELIQDEGADMPAWRYSLARMTSVELKVRLDDSEVWSTTFYWRGPRSPADPYVEANHGPLPAAFTDSN
jgi:hypothetical protein